jgi:opacity protein-like surface antigen
MRVRFLAFVVSIAVMLALTAKPAAAQAKPAAAQTRAPTDGWGLKGGLTFTNLDLNIPDFNVSAKSQTGFTAGAFYGIRLAGPLHVDIEGLFTTKGAKYDLEDLENRIRLTYLEVPVLARVGVFRAGRTTGYVSGGPSFAFKLKEVQEEDGEETPRSNDAKKYDVGFAFGGGVSFGRWIVDARYTLGVTDIVDVEAQFSGPSTAKNRFFALTAGYRW